MNLVLFFLVSASAAKYMLLDDRNIIEADAKFVLGKVVKHPGGAIIKEERDYEMRFDNMQPNVWYDPAMKKWRAWYSAFTSCSKPLHTIPYCDNQPQQCGSVAGSSKAGRGSGFLYAESDDGLKWYKPSLNMTDWKGSKANNLIENGGMTTGIYLDEDTKDPSQRYKIATGSNGAGGIATSADGIHWSAVKNLASETHARWDTPKNVVWDAARKQWIMYVRSTPTASEKEGGSLRVQAYTHSLTDDFMGDWAPAAPTGLNSSADYQPDGLVAFPYEGIYIGIGNVFNPTQEDGAAAVKGQVNMVLGWSADGRRWKWLVPNDSIVPLGESGDFDACGVFGAKQDPLRMARAVASASSAADEDSADADADTLRLYYAGCNGPFFGSRGCGLGLATLQRDGFAGYTGGKVVTGPVRVSSAKGLTVSVDGGSGGGVRVGVVGDSELTVENCDPIKGKATDAAVTWKGKAGLSTKTNGAVSLVFDIPDDATAFAFSL